MPVKINQGTQCDMMFQVSEANSLTLISELRENHRLDMQEAKITHELELVDLKQSLQRTQNRLQSLENKSEFRDVLLTYNSQMSEIE